MSRAGVSRFKILTTARALYEQTGNVPTNTQVREALGGSGSMSTISPVMAEFRQQIDAEKGNSGALKQARHEVTRAVDQAYDILEASIHTEYTESLSKLQDELSQQGELLKASTEALSETQAELEESSAKLARNRQLLEQSEHREQAAERNRQAAEAAAEDARLVANERQETISILSQQLEQHREDSQQAIIRHETELAKRDKRENELEMINNQLKDELSTQNEENLTLSNNLDAALSTIERLEEEKESATKEFRQVATKLDDANEALGRLRTEHAVSLTELAGLRKRIDELSNDLVEERSHSKSLTEALQAHQQPKARAKPKSPTKARKKST